MNDNRISETAIEFLKESNNIEGVWDDDSLIQAVFAWNYILAHKELTTSNILKTHKILMLHQNIRPNEKGYFRTVDIGLSKNGVIIKQFPHPKTVQESMQQWIINANDVIKNGKKEDKKYLASLTERQHVTYEGIHPFIDGNGRTGRIFWNWQKVKLGLDITIIALAEREKYYELFR